MPIDSFTVLLFTFYLAADAPKVRQELFSLFPPARQGELVRAWQIALDKTGGYIYSRALMALVSGICHFIVFWILDMLAQLPAINERWHAELAEPIRLGIGVNSGRASVGQIGSHIKFKYGPRGSVVSTDHGKVW